MVETAREENGASVALTAAGFLLTQKVGTGSQRGSFFLRG